MRDSSGDLYSKTETTWDSTTPYTGVTFVYADETLDYVYDGDEDYKRIKAEYAYDTYGNLTSTKEYGDFDVSGDERETVNEFTYNTSDYIVNNALSNCIVCRSHADG